VGKVRKDYWKFKDEKPLFAIDASNVDKYADHLTDGQITALKTVKGSDGCLSDAPDLRNHATYAERTKPTRRKPRLPPTAGPAARQGRRRAVSDPSPH